jgi:hypothetical protein
MAVESQATDLVRFTLDSWDSWFVGNPVKNNQGQTTSVKVTDMSYGASLFFEPGHEIYVGPIIQDGQEIAPSLDLLPVRRFDSPSRRWTAPFDCNFEQALFEKKLVGTV